MFNLSQDGTITQYYDTFIALPNRMDGMSPKSLLTCFINGLKTEIHIDIIPLKPDSLPQAMQLARLYEDKYSDKCPMITRRSTKHNVFTLAVHSVIGHSKFNSGAISSSSKPWVNSQQIQGSTQQSLPGSSGNSQPFKRITFNEMQLRHAKGVFIVMRSILLIINVQIKGYYCYNGVRKIFPRRQFLQLILPWSLIIPCL